MPHTTLISTETLHAHLSDPNWVVVDCRFALKNTEKGYEDYKLAHIPNARYAHLDRDLSGTIVPGVTGRHPLPEIDLFAQKLGSWGIDAPVQVVAYDDAGGPYAARLWTMLKWLGHEAAAVLDGGWPKWVLENRPVSRDAPSVTPRTFAPRLNRNFHAEVSDVEKATHEPQTCLLDAREEPRFAGRHEPIDPVAGRIPSAVSFPWADNLDENKCFLPPDVLAKRFEGIDTGRAISYCGSGVTAAHNMLAIAHAGLPLPRLYAGSWSEWITSPDRQIEKD